MSTEAERAARKARRPKREPRVFREERAEAYRLGLERGVVAGIELALKWATDEGDHDA